MIEIDALYRDIGELRASIARRSDTPHVTRIEALRILQAMEALAGYIKQLVTSMTETEG